jgi:hypothetical protein
LLSFSDDARVEKVSRPRVPDLAKPREVHRDVGRRHASDRVDSFDLAEKSATMR